MRNQRLNAPKANPTGSNLTDLGQVAVRTPAFGWGELPGGLMSPVGEATVKVCGVAVAMRGCPEFRGTSVTARGCSGHFFIVLVSGMTYLAPRSRSVARKVGWVGSGESGRISQGRPLYTLT